MLKSIWWTGALALLAVCVHGSCADAKEPELFKRLPKLVDFALNNEDSIKSAITILESIDLASDDVKLVTPKIVRDTAKVIRKHAEAWADDGEAPKGSKKVVAAIRKLTDTTLKREKDDSDAHSASAHTFVAVALDQIARGEADDSPAAFSTAAKAFAKVAELKPSKKTFYLVEAAEVLRIGSKYAGTKLPMIEEASTYLDVAFKEDPKSKRVLAELGHNLAARTTLLLQDGNKGEAKKTISKGLEMLAPEEGARPDKKIYGAYNALVDLALKHKLLKKLKYATKAAQNGSFKYEFPYGTGWKSEGASELPGDSIMSLRRRDGKSSMRIGVSSYGWDTLYGSLGGDNPKGLLRAIDEAWTQALQKAKSRSASKSELPRWVKKANGFSVTGNDGDGLACKSWGWTFKGNAGHLRTYAVILDVVGEMPKKVPPQLSAIVKSLVENPQVGHPA